MRKTYMAAWLVLILMSKSLLAFGGRDAPFTVHGAGNLAAYSVNGLAYPVEMLIDKWGVAHIYAKTVEDAFYAQGFNAAKDRLWQMDMWHRRGLGKLSEVLGPDYVKHDTAARHFLYQGSMGDEWSVYGEGAREKVEAFVRGINAYIKLTESDDSLLPSEFRRGGFRPSYWTAEDVVKIRIHALVSNLGKEVSHAKTICKYGLKADQLKSKLEPDHVISIPEGLDVCSIPSDVLSLYNHAHLSLAILPPGRIVPDEEQLAYLEQVTQMQGSNSWVISADKSETGRAVFAGDPHRVLGLPSSRYIVHMSAPGMDVVGAGEPFAPGISMGQNGNIAYGLTYFYSDQEDLYIYDTNPDAPDQYRYGGDWESFRVEKQTIKVLGGNDQEITVRFSRHGPVIFTDTDNNRAYSVRAAKLGAGGSPYLGSLRLMDAKGWQDFADAMQHWYVPTLNMMYADKDGEIGWKPTGLAPRRTNWDGLLPVPGDGRYEWSGFVPVSEKLGEKSPKRGWIATANSMNLPDGCTGEECRVGYEWASPYRYRRIEQVLSSYDKVPFAASGDLHMDQKISFADWLVSLVQDLRHRKKGELSDGAVRALAFFSEWDGVMSKGSAQAHMFDVWYEHHIGPDVFEAFSPARVDGKAPLEADMLVVLDILKQSEFEDFEGNTITRDQLLTNTLTAAFRDMEEKFGADPKEWAWGKVNRMHLKPLMVPGRGNEAINNCGAAQGEPIGGSAWTVNIAIRSSKDPSRVVIGAAPRLIFDVGEWDNSIGGNLPGQSADEASPNYCNLYSSWKDGIGFPLLYTREAIRQNVSQRMVLKPRRTQEGCC